MNGTAILRQGLPPAVNLRVGVRHWLKPDDVIELAGSDEFQFAFQSLQDCDRASSNKTSPMRRSARGRDPGDVLHTVEYRVSSVAERLLLHVTKSDPAVRLSPTLA